MKRCALPVVAVLAASSLLFGQSDNKSSPAKEPAKTSKEKPTADAITMTVVTRTGKRNRNARADKIQVFVVINGDTRHKTHLDNPRRDDFELGATDTFKNIPVKLPLEEIETIRLAVEGDDMWHCESITFQFFQKELQSRPYKFNPNRYLSGAEVPAKGIPDMQRRRFLKMGIAGAAAAALPAESIPPSAAAADPPNSVKRAVPVDERICLFTDHLDDFGYSYADVAAMVKPLKIAGPDLTVRGGGLVPPERVAEELPKAAAAFRDQGLTIPMISTNLTSARDPAARPTLAAMAKLGIRYFKAGYYHYRDLDKWDVELEAQRKDLAGLVELGREFNAHAGLHNHSGATIGGAVWDGWEFLRPLDPALCGFYFDPSHATIEGGRHAWKLNFQRISARLTMVAVKDFVWEKTVRGWQTRWCPLGEGMVNWTEFFRMLARFSFPGPLSIHIEYDPGGSTRPDRIDNSLAAAQRDVAFVRQHLAKAPS